LSGIIVGVSLKEKLQVQIGDCVQVTSPTIGFTYTRGAIRAPVARQFRVVAVFDAGFDQYDSKLVYTDLYESQAFYDNGDSVTGVEMKVDDIDRARQIKYAVDDKLHNGLYNTMDWEELNHGLFTALRIQQIVMSLVLALIIVVAAFTVFAILMMMVTEKRRDIGILTALGATRRGILAIFLLIGMWNALLGSLLGATLGVLGALRIDGIERWLSSTLGVQIFDRSIYLFDHIPSEVSPLIVGCTVLGALFFTLLFSLVPALLASRTHPIDALRAE
jgi:lipoprotein-releasing system permease protein